ncbi:hypothetical protein AC482_02825 [miscellaneous Crenarchaeota group-15 archaeon DG-45]|uniref:Uncharacterized protein n=1 Tax=miscellaneous Crenarchaeota group-15 archaeon DG-45 TaxID=1685127 RepID=A0A0M0BQM9_9ARCH|nr:MAG: hypothetical protein AC482_02825 [miscellaneous Crenarchaeota group-15 archaeon DG-45]
MTGRRELTPSDVRGLVFEALDVIADAQSKLQLPICPHLEETRERLRGGEFRAEPFIADRGGPYDMDHGAFEPPSTIILDSSLPFCDWPLSIPEFPEALARYCATHEVIHADDHTGGDRLLRETRGHILREHGDKLESGMFIIEAEGGGDSIRSWEELAELWANQYVDMVTHYRSYVALRHRRLPKLDYIWAGLNKDFFPPNLLTRIERQRGVEYVFDVIERRAGSYCLIDALREFESIGERSAYRYTV